MITKVRNDLFKPQLGLNRERTRLIEGIWYLVKIVFFQSSMIWPQLIKAEILRWFGAEIGKGVYIKPRVNIHMPWKLQVGDYAWIGEEVFILNFERIVIGKHCCISQRAFLCTGNHDFRDIGMRYRNKPIIINDGAWVGAQCFVGPGVAVGVDSVITAGTIVAKSVGDGCVFSGNPCQKIGLRWRE